MNSLWTELACPLFSSHNTSCWLGRVQIQSWSLNPVRLFSRVWNHWHFKMWNSTFKWLCNKVFIVKIGPEDFQMNIGISKTCLDVKTNHNSMLLTTRLCGPLKQFIFFLALVSCNFHLHIEFPLRVCMRSYSRLLLLCNKWSNLVA